MLTGYLSLNRLKFGPSVTPQFHYYLGISWIHELFHSTIGLAIKDI